MTNPPPLPGRRASPQWQPYRGHPSPFRTARRPPCTVGEEPRSVIASEAEPAFEVGHGDGREVLDDGAEFVEGPSWCGQLEGCDPVGCVGVAADLVPGAGVTDGAGVGEADSTVRSGRSRTVTGWSLKASRAQFPARCRALPLVAVPEVGLGDVPVRVVRRGGLGVVTAAGPVVDLGPVTVSGTSAGEVSSRGVGVEAQLATAVTRLDLAPTGVGRPEIMPVAGSMVTPAGSSAVYCTVPSGILVIAAVPLTCSLRRSPL